MAENVKNKRIAKLMQQILSDIFLEEGKRFIPGEVLVTVTEVRLSGDLGTAKIYLSFMLAKDPQQLLEQVAAKTNEVRKLLGDRIGQKVRKIPALVFFADETASKAASMDTLLDSLGTEEEIGFYDEESF